jgi:hypothetical protein
MLKSVFENKTARVGEEREKRKKEGRGERRERERGASKHPT